MITSYDEAIDRLRTTSGLSVCPRPLFVLPLLRAGLLTTVLSLEAADAGWADEFGTDFHALESLTGARDHTGTSAGIHQVLCHAPAPSRGPAWRGRELTLMPYQSLQPHWRDALDDLGTRLVEPHPQTTAPILSNKVAQRSWFRSIGAAAPRDAVLGSLENLEHRTLRHLFGEVYVVQSPQGAGGHGTHLVTCEDDLRPLRSAAGPWLVSEYIDGTPLNVHGLVSADGTVSVLRTSVQLTRVDGIGAPFGTYSGCDFGAPGQLPGRALTRAGDTVARLGAGLAELGYRGLFGADFVLDGDRPLLLELNCRMQGSTWLLGELELAEDALPGALRHVLERHGHTTRAEPRLDPSDASQLVIRHTGGAVRVTAAPVGGLHRLKDDELHHCGPGHGLLECGPDDCVLLQLPSVGTVLQPDVPLARLVARYSLTTPDGRTLTPRGRQLVDAVRACFAFTPC
ncbi:ATP-grasp domain-containing protein [Kitasatospora sp. NPDC097643]|uniref:ATP-grasp domain-containing protein n=1 Tax=Kitasatospora sp. NPDC097643 TaxID=3157230 RepID=UPI003326DCC2